jgi:hypothetical protein
MYVSSDVFCQTWNFFWVNNATWFLATKWVFQMLKKVLIKLKGYLFYKENKNFPKPPKSFWKEAIGSYRETTLRISRSHSIDTIRYFLRPQEIFSQVSERLESIHTFQMFSPGTTCTRQWNQKVYCPVQSSQPLDPILNNINPVCVISPSIFYLLRFSKILSSRLYLHIFLQDFSNKSFYAFLSSPLLVICPTELIGQT